MTILAQRAAAIRKLMGQYINETRRNQYLKAKLLIAERDLAKAKWRK